MNNENVEARPVRREPSSIIWSTFNKYMPIVIHIVDMNDDIVSMPYMNVFILFTPYHIVLDM